MKFTFTDGWTLGDMSANIAKADSYTLAEDEKRPFINVAMSAASKALTLGLEVGEVMVVSNIGASNAVTVKCIDGDTGSSVAAGKVALCIGQAAANASKIYVLN